MMLETWLPRIIVSAVIIISLPIVKKVLNKIIQTFGDSSYRSLRVKQMKQIVSIGVNITGVILLAITWNIHGNIIGSLTAIFAVIGVALFAQWSILSNVTAGVVMFFNAPYRVGDLIHIIDKDAPITAQIISIGTFYTYIKDTEGYQIVLPNNIFLQKTVQIKKSAEELEKEKVEEAQNQTQEEINE